LLPQLLLCCFHCCCSLLLLQQLLPPLPLGQLLLLPSPSIAFVFALACRRSYRRH
jgi:hypothetical protein